ncbi:hypothetical protein EDD21DRAFT_356729 [Dissophora ornata]|nr:hypothetical protein EDD21DRAFT_356729 [Dissophora ornata]
MSGLKVKDIFIDPNDFKPRDLAVPFSFPRDQERWMVRFTPEDFKTFWFQEQTAIQFVPCSEQGPNRNIRNQSGDTLLPFYITVPGNKGRPKTYDWSFRFQCRRHGSPRTLAINRPSIGTGCPVEIRLKKPVGMDAVLVDYRWQHNHDLSAKTLSNMPMGANERNWIKLKVAEGNDWKGIRALLRMDDDSMTEVLFL